MMAADCDQGHYCKVASEMNAVTICGPCHECAARNDAVEGQCPRKCDGASEWDNELVEDCAGHYVPVRRFRFN
eukprot:SAG31_NODE_2_length_46263_cov_45.908043_20_plen_73_part_00